MQAYHKNQNYNEIKSHHYILSFDPNDKDEHGLTGERAQQLGLEYAKKNFPGHQLSLHTYRRTQWKWQYSCTYCNQQPAEI